jgi:hypothetical protein
MAEIVEGRDPYPIAARWTRPIPGPLNIVDEMFTVSNDGGVTYSFTGQALEQLLTAAGFTPDPSTVPPAVRAACCGHCTHPTE